VECQSHSSSTPAPRLLQPGTPMHWASAARGTGPGTRCACPWPEPSPPALAGGYGSASFCSLPRIDPSPCSDVPWPGTTPEGGRPPPAPVPFGRCGNTPQRPPGSQADASRAAAHCMSRRAWHPHVKEHPLLLWRRIHLSGRAHAQRTSGDPGAARIHRGLPAPEALADSSLSRAMPESAAAPPGHASWEKSPGAKLARIDPSPERTGR
jgi:hypothetical protein